MDRLRYLKISKIERNKNERKMFEIKKNIYIYINVSNENLTDFFCQFVRMDIYIL